MLDRAESFERACHEAKRQLAAAESKVAELEAALRPDEFLRQWYEQMKADDPHHFEEYDGEDFTTYGAYTFEEHFSQCAFITAFTKSIAALLAAPVAPAGQEKE